MTIQYSQSLQTLLDAAEDRAEWSAILSAAMGGSRRMRCKRHASSSAPNPWGTGVEFANVALAGAFGWDVVTGAINNFGSAFNATVMATADLATGSSVFRIEGASGHWIQGTLGLAGSATAGADYVLHTNPTTTSGFGFAPGATLAAPASLPLPTVLDAIPPSVSLAVSSTMVTAAGGLNLTATASDNIGVSKVEFYRSGGLVGTVFSAPFTFTDALTFGLNGTLTYTARAYDAGNNSTLSSAKIVTVNIEAPTETGTPVAVGAAITTVTFENTAASSITNVPVTFGQVFKVGELPLSGAAVELKKADNSIVPAQLDVKASHPDGSVRHAVISALLPAMASSESQPMSIVRKTAGTSPTPATAASFVTAGMDAVVTIVEGGVTYSASLAAMIATATLKPWLTGGVVNEWLLSGPLKTTANVEHLLLHVRFAVRAFTGTTKAKIDVTVENTWVIPDPNSLAGGNVWVSNSPTDVTYDVTVTVPGETTFTQAALYHHDKARWIKTFWWNGAPTVHIKHNAPYLISTKAVPNYDQTVVPLASKIAADKANFLTKNAPMKAGLTTPGQGNTGGRPDIGLNPGWCIIWLLSQNKDAKESMLGTGLLAASFAVHYRNKGTDRPVDIQAYPYACISKGSSTDDRNPATMKHEMVPPRVGGITNPNGADGPHQPNLSYIPYLITGDYAHLEELQFVNEWNALRFTPGYRGFALGYVKQTQVRGVAWLMRTLADTAWISPDGDPIKTRSTAALNTNFDYFIAQHVNGSDPLVANQLGILHNPTGGYNGVIYPAAQNSALTAMGVSPWQDDFVTQSFGHMAELGYAKARTFLNWKVKFAIGRMMGEGFCWIQGTNYSLDCRGTPGGPLFTTFAEVYEASIHPSIKATACNSQAMADANTAVHGDYGTYVIGQMPKYSHMDDGFPANLQPAMAYAATSDHPQGADAWLIFSSRAKIPLYTTSPVFAIVPRV